MLAQSLIMGLLGASRNRELSQFVDDIVSVLVCYQAYHVLGVCSMLANLVIFINLGCQIVLNIADVLNWVLHNHWHIWAHGDNHT